MNYVLWFTGLSGSGKSTLAQALSQIFKKSNFTVEVIDGDDFRKKIHSKLGFSEKEIILNNKKIIEYCQKRLRAKNFIRRKTLFILVPVIAPIEATRRFARKKIGAAYVEIFCKASVETCRQRDPKGLYKKALEGRLKNLIGIDKGVPYQKPTHPDIIVDTQRLSIKESLEEILKYLQSRKIHDFTAQKN